MRRLSSGFVLGYHGCDVEVAEVVLRGRALIASKNEYDWLGEGIYFWEANPIRGLDYARESMSRRNSKIRTPTVIGAVIDLGTCLDLTTSFGILAASRAYDSLTQSENEAGRPIPENTPDKLRRKLDCAVINRIHQILREDKLPPFDTVRGIFTEGGPAYPGAGFDKKTHVQIAVRNPDCIKGVFRVPKHHLDPPPF